MGVFRIEIDRQARTRRDQLVAVVDLYGALGGGWPVEEGEGRAQYHDGGMPGRRPAR